MHNGGGTEQESGAFAAAELERLKELIAINRTIVNEVEFDEVLRLVVNKTAGFAGADACVLLLANAGEQARVVASFGLDSERACCFSAPLDERIDDALRALLDLREADSFVGSPLIGRGGIIGVLAVCKRARTDQDLRSDEHFLLSALADQAAITIEHTRYRREQCAAELELRRRADELLMADRRKDELLSMLAHELRNPLAPMLGAVQVMRIKALKGTTTPPGREIEIIERQVRHLARLLDDLLDVSRFIRGTIELRMEALPLAAGMAQAVEASRPHIDAKGHHLTVTLPEEDLSVKADPVRLAQILSNLLNNAAKYTDSGGHIAISAERQEDAAVIRVRDTGMGIPKDLLPHVFDLFTQGSRTVDRSQGGLGIGLTLVHKLVTLHGGCVEAHSRGPGCGSEFVVTLPLVRALYRPDEGAARTEQVQARRRLRVLLVEDNVDTAETMACLLALHGYETEVAHSGPAGLKAALRSRPDVVLLDIGLPEMDGYEIARQLQSELGERVPLLVAMSGYSQPNERRKSTEAGFRHHLVKPVEFEEIERILASHSIL